MATNTTVAPSAIFAYRAVHTLSGLVSDVIRWNEARRTRAALSRLSAHELDDIGLTRGDVANFGITR